MTTANRFEALESLHRTLRVNTERGTWAVAMVGWKGWGRDSAIGDGITSATSSLLTRCETQAEAVQLAERLNDLQAGVLPGSMDVPVYVARKYDITDYLSSQDQRNGNRKCDRRIVDRGN